MTEIFNVTILYNVITCMLRQSYSNIKRMWNSHVHTPFITRVVLSFSLIRPHTRETKRTTSGLKATLQRLLMHAPLSLLDAGYATCD